MGRTPVRATVIREPEPVAKPKHGKTRLRKQASQRSLLDIDAGIVSIINDQYETDLQWVTDSVLGQPSPQSRMAFEINAWEPVTPDMFDGLLDGMFTRKGHKGEIHYEGLVLMHRPMELTLEAQEEDRQARDNAMEAQRGMIMNGVIPGLSNASTYNPNNQKALAGNQFQRSVKPPMDIPTE